MPTRPVLRCALPLLLAGTALAQARIARADETRALSEPLANVSVLGGLGIRRAKTDPAVNPDGIAYEPGFALSVQGRAYAAKWLSLSLVYVRSYHGIAAPQGAAGIDYDERDLPTLFAFSLGARAEPTYRVSDQFRAWLSVGVGWGRLTLDDMYVRKGTREYTVRDRAGVFMEVPFGLGACFEFLPGWAAVSAEASLAPIYKQSGDLFDPVTFVDNEGHLDSVGNFPTQTLTSTFLIGLAVVL